MSGTIQPLTRNDLEAKIVKRCWENEAFRKEFTADPAGAFTKYLAVPAASLPKIVVHEEARDTWHIVIPAKPANLGELPEQDLETVAGGEHAVVKLSFAVTGIAVSATVAATATYSVRKETAW